MEDPVLFVMQPRKRVTSEGCTDPPTCRRDVHVLLTSRAHGEESQMYPVFMPQYFILHYTAEILEGFGNITWLMALLDTNFFRIVWGPILISPCSTFGSRPSL